MMRQWLVPLNRATCTYMRSRMVSDWARTARVGHIQESAAIKSAISSTDTTRTREATTTRINNDGMVRKTSVTSLIDASTNPPK